MTWRPGVILDSWRAAAGAQASFPPSSDGIQVSLEHPPNHDYLGLVGSAALDQAKPVLSGGIEQGERERERRPAGRAYQFATAGYIWPLDCGGRW